MRIEPTGRLAEMLAVRGDLLAGFDIDNDFLRMHSAEVALSHPNLDVEELSALCAYSAYFHPDAPHNFYKQAPPWDRKANEAPAAVIEPVNCSQGSTLRDLVREAEASSKAIRTAADAVATRETRANVTRWIQIVVLILIFIAIATRAHAQSSGGVIVRGSNGASVLVTRSAGLLNFKCDGTTVICNWTPGTNTFALTAGASVPVANWNTAGNTHLFVFMDAGRAPNLAATGFSTYASKVVYVTALPANVSGAINSIDGFYEATLGGGFAGAVAVYSDNGAGTRSLLASAVSLLNGQPQTWALGSTVTITAGSLYWLAWCTDSATAALYSVTHNANEVSLYNIGTQVRIATAANPCTGSGTELTFPATLGALTANASGDTAPYLQGRP